MNILTKSALAAIAAITFSVLPVSGRVNLPGTVAARDLVNGATAGEVGGGTRAVSPEGSSDIVPGTA